MSQARLAEVSTQLPVSADDRALGVWALCDGLGVAMQGPLCTLLWRERVDDARYALQAEAVAHVVRTHPKRALILCVIEAGSPPPPEHLRKRASALLRESAPQLRGMSCVIEGVGFGASVIRGVLSSIEAIGGGYPFPTRYHENAAEGLAWLRGHGQVEPGAVQCALARLRLLLPPRSSPSLVPRRSLVR